MYNNTYQIYLSHRLNFKIRMHSKTKFKKGDLIVEVNTCNLLIWFILKCFVNEVHLYRFHVIIYEAYTTQRCICSVPKMYLDIEIRIYPFHIQNGYKQACSKGVSEYWNLDSSLSYTKIQTNRSKGCI